MLIFAACACTANEPLINPATAAPAISVFDVMLTFLVGLLVFARLRSGARPPGADQMIGANVIERSYTRAHGFPLCYSFHFGKPKWFIFLKTGGNARIVSRMTVASCSQEGRISKIRTGRSSMGEPPSLSFLICVVTFRVSLQAMAVMHSGFPSFQNRDNDRI